jgi:hypothetical protein
MLALYYATMIAANEAADKLDAIIAIGTAQSLSLSHKIALSDLSESGECVKRCRQAVLV